MRFQIVAYQPQGDVFTLVLEALSFDAARAQARERGLNIISIRQQWRWAAQRRRKDPPFDVLLFSQELRSLLDAGLSLIESLLTLARKELNRTRQQLIEVLIRQLREGKPFSAALREFPAIFPPLYVALAAASEQTGHLGASLKRFIEYRQQMDTARKRVVSAAIYPALLVGVGGLVIVFLMTYVVPRFSRVYEEFGRDLPFMSRLLMQWGGLLNEYGLELLLGLVALAALLIWLVRQTTLRSLWHRLLSQPLLQGIRNRLQIYTLARFFRTLGLLLQEGIPITAALGLARELLDEEGQLALDRVTLSIRAGVALSETMVNEGLAPPVAAELLKIGEKAGDVGEKMVRIADFYDEEIARWSEWFLKLFEPLLMLTIGLFIAFIVVLLYLPIFELAGTL